MRFAVATLVLLLAGCAPILRFPYRHPAARPAVQPAPPVLPAPDSTLARAALGRPSVPGEPTPRPYAQVIPRGARTREGLFRTHLAGSRLYYEIPRAALGRDMLLVTQIARNTAGLGYGGQAVGNRVLRWERRDNRILLRSVSHEITADSTLPIYRAVAAASYDPVVASFPIEAFGPDSAAVIEVSRLFLSSPPEFGVASQIRGALDRERSFIERVASFPTNVEVEATHTYSVVQSRPAGSAEAGPASARTASVVMHWSMLLLPEKPMQPRLHDSRVGFFSVERLDYGTEEHRAARRRFITRWRLECPDGQSVPCEPVKPIVFYLDPATPDQWRPFIRQGVEDWQRAFEEAGFRNAILAREAPSPQEDPDWSPEDARYSVIRWLPSTIENAQGPHIHDPRSGEILEADIKIYHNILNLNRDWYFLQAAPLDARAHRLPLPDSLMGRLLQYVVAHEVGHTLGFPHNMKASATYAVDSIRNVDFLRRMRHTPTLMDYARFNYVAQPEDGIPPELLVPDIGPYDVFATVWGYRPVPGAATPEAEREELDRWARAQDAAPYLRFSTEGTEGADAGDHTEAVGDADPVTSTRLGIRNLRRVASLLIPAVERPGEDFADLHELYDRLVGQWRTELRHVVTLVGGVESQEKRWGQEGPRFQPVARGRQAEAVRFLNQEAFRTPEFLLDREILRRIEVEGALERIGRSQTALLALLLDDRRMQRMTEFEALAERPGEVYTVGELLSEVRRGIWSELPAPSVRIDPFRRRLQRSYLDLVQRKVEPALFRTTAQAPGAPPVSAPGTADDARALLRGELRALDAEIAAALARTGDRTTRLHLEDIRVQIQRTLDPRR